MNMETIVLVVLVQAVAAAALFGLFAIYLPNRRLTDEEKVRRWSLSTKD
jgi:isoprenylcysteine carboxyl methyltransferase (ICMT) family protein YpbQ